MRCVDARQLFDAFLNGELSSSMATELQAHRVKCADCRRELALMEVSGHVLCADADPVALDDSFTDRLIACMDEPKSRWAVRLRWMVYVGTPLAAAAVVAMAFLGFFDTGGKGKVAGVSLSVEEVLGQPPVPSVLVDAPISSERATDQDDSPVGEAEAPVARFGHGPTDTVGTPHRGEPLTRALDMTILQLIDILEEAKETPAVRTHLPEGSDAVGGEKRGALPDPDGVYDRKADR